MSGILVTRAGPLTTLTLDRPDRRNALSPDLMSELADAVRRAAEDADVLFGDRNLAQVVDALNRPAPEEAGSDWGSVGVFCFQPQAAQFLDAWHDRAPVYNAKKRRRRDPQESKHRRRSRIDGYEIVSSAGNPDSNREPLQP